MNYLNSNFQLKKKCDINIFISTCIGRVRGQKTFVLRGICPKPYRTMWIMFYFVSQKYRDMAIETLSLTNNCFLTPTFFFMIK